MTNALNPCSRSRSATRALVAVLGGGVVLLAGLAVAVWLAGRWMVAPLCPQAEQRARSFDRGVGYIRYRTFRSTMTPNEA